MKTVMTFKINQYFRKFASSWMMLTLMKNNLNCVNREQLTHFSVLDQVRNAQLKIGNIDNNAEAECQREISVQI